MLTQEEMAVAKMFGNTEEDIRRFGGSQEDAASPEPVTARIPAWVPPFPKNDAVMAVAKMMGNTAEDIRRFGKEAEND